MGLPNHTVILCSIFWGLTRLFSSTLLQPPAMHQGFNSSPSCQNCYFVFVFIVAVRWLWMCWFLLGVSWWAAVRWGLGPGILRCLPHVFYEIGVGAIAGVVGNVPASNPTTWLVWPSSQHGGFWVSQNNPRNRKWKLSVSGDLGLDSDMQYLPLCSLVKHSAVAPVSRGGTEVSMKEGPGAPEGDPCICLTCKLWSPFKSHLKQQKLNIQKTKIMVSGPITSWEIDGETVETVTNFIFMGSKITEDGDCSQEIKRCLLLGRKVMTNLDSILKSRDITLPTKIHLV